MFKCFLLVCCGGLWVSGLAVGGEAPPAPQPPKVDPPAPKTDPAPYGEAAADLPLPLYQDLRQKLEVAQGVRKEAPGKPAPLGKGEAEAALKVAAKERQEVLLRALLARQAIHRELAAAVLPFGEKSPVLLGALQKALGTDPDQEVRRTAAQGLGRLQDAGSVDSFVKALEDQDLQVRSLAIKALGEIKDSRACPPLLRVLQRDEDPMVRMRAAGALGKIKEGVALETLMAALEAEKDQRVKMAIAGAVRQIRDKPAPGAPAAAEGPTAEEHGNALTELSREMRTVEDKLRNDRHDQGVQTDQGGIEQKLSRMIEEIEKMQCSSCKGQSQKQQGSQQNQQKEQGGSQKSGSPTNPLKDSNLGGSAARGALQPGQVSGTQDAWAKLPPQLREEMLQIYREGLPERWQKRLQAYFESVAAEQTKE